MDDAEEMDPPGRNRLNVVLSVIGIAAAVTAMAASGGLALLAGATAIGCLVGSVIAGNDDDESRFEQDCRACDGCEPAVTVEPNQKVAIEVRQGQPDHHWRHTVAARTQAGRGR